MKKQLLALIAAVFLIIGFTSTSEAATKNGWLSSNGHWYFYKSGSLYKGWLSSGGKWYYLDSSGAMKTGWLNTGGKWYYLDASGVMKTGWLYVGGKWYYLDASGTMKTGWLYTGGKWYYLDASGAMKTGWVYISGKWYYLYSNGVMAANTTIGGYSLGANGAMIQQTMPESMVKYWVSPKESIVSRLTIAGNGYKGIDDWHNYQLFNSAGNLLYTYTSPTMIQDSKLYKDGTAYLLVGTNGLSGNLVALDTSGKVKWTKNLAQYDEVYMTLNQDGSLYAEGASEVGGWNLIRIDPNTGNTIWSAPNQGGAAINSNGYVAINNGDRNLSLYKDGQLQWQSSINDVIYDGIEDMYVSSNGNVAVVYNNELTVQEFGSNGVSLTERKLELNKEQLGQVIFNDNGELLVSYISTLTGKYNYEWYDTEGKLTNNNSFSIPSADYANYDGFGNDEYIVKVDNAKNIYFRIATDAVYKYNVSGTLVGKTSFPTNLKYEYEEDLGLGLVYSQHDKNSQSNNYIIYNYN